uniref:Uncharacterized protein n=1 Tax=Anguilla anguilla TaxID=7936 RepID=A0A0E9QS29_ANGAN
MALGHCPAMLTLMPKHCVIFAA